MSQNDFTIANQGFPAFRADLNSALQALASNSSGATAPSTTFANMWWYDSANNIMYIRNEDNDAWIKFAELDQTNDKFVLSGTLQLDDGTVSAPALTFNSDTNMGIYRGGTDILKFVTAGTDAITIDASQGVTLAGKLDVSSGTIKLDGNYPVGTNNVALGNQALDSGSLSGGNNTAVGYNALTANTTATYNTAVGYIAGQATTTGVQNTVVGAFALENNTTGASNVAIGLSSLKTNTTANDNVGVGQHSLRLNTTGASNTAVGGSSLFSNTTASSNNAFGYQALYSNTTGDENNSFGRASLYANTTGQDNVAMGHTALRFNTTGSYNTGLGYSALYSNTTASSNTAVGYQALYDNTTGQNNTIVGRSAGANITTASGNTFIGKGAGESVTTGAKNTVIGLFNGNQGGLDITTLSNNIVLSDGDGNPHGYYRSNQWTFQISTNDLFTTIHRVNGVHANPYGIGIIYTDCSPDDQNGRFLSCVDSSVLRLAIYNDGDVQNHDNSYGGLSDIKLKEQITDASSQWDDIKALTVRKYKMKSDVATGDSDAHWRLGVVAQEVETAGMGGLVKESPDRDADNNDLGTTTKSVKYSILYMKAVKALQEAMERIETLEAKVATLEGE